MSASTRAEYSTKRFLDYQPKTAFEIVLNYKERTRPIDIFINKKQTFIQFCQIYMYVIVLGYLLSTLPA